jgi:hypothetical protein
MVVFIGASRNFENGMQNGSTGKTHGALLNFECHVKKWSRGGEDLGAGGEEKELRGKGFGVGEN